MVSCVPAASKAPEWSVTPELMVSVVTPLRFRPASATVVVPTVVLPVSLTTSPALAPVRVVRYPLKAVIPSPPVVGYVAKSVALTVA